MSVGHRFGFSPSGSGKQDVDAAAGGRVAAMCRCPEPGLLSVKMGEPRLPRGQRAVVPDVTFGHIAEADRVPSWAPAGRPAVRTAIPPFCGPALGARPVHSARAPRA